MNIACCCRPLWCARAPEQLPRRCYHLLSITRSNKSRLRYLFCCFLSNGGDSSVMAERVYYWSTQGQLVPTYIRPKEIPQAFLWAERWAILFDGGLWGAVTGMWRSMYRKEKLSRDLPQGGWKSGRWGVRGHRLWQTKAEKRERYYRFCASCTVCERVVVDTILPHIIAMNKGICYPHLGRHVHTLWQIWALQFLLSSSTELKSVSFI